MHGVHMHMRAWRVHGVCTVCASQAYSAACGKELPYKIAPRRPGDVAVVYADPAFAAQELGWTAELGLEQMCKDSWNWIGNNPDGFDTTQA